MALSRISRNVLQIRSNEKAAAQMITCAVKTQSSMRNFVLIRGLAWLSATAADGADWAGVWKGSLTNSPPAPNAKAVAVTMEIGSWPAADHTCAMWRSTYREEGVVKQVKDYRLCRGAGAEELFLDEGNGSKLSARWIADMLVVPFKYNKFLLISTMRLRDGVLEEEILTIEDKPATDGVLALNPAAVQRIVLRRTQDTN
jgi:hypothetical protein